MSSGPTSISDHVDALSYISANRHNPKQKTSVGSGVGVKGGELHTNGHGLSIGCPEESYMSVMVRCNQTINYIAYTRQHLPTLWLILQKRSPLYGMLLI